QRVTGAAVDHEEVLARLQARRNVLRRGGLRALVRVRPGRDPDAEDEDDQPEDDEGAPLHLARGSILPRFRYQGHILRSPHSRQRGFGRQIARPWRIRLMCSSYASSGGVMASISSCASSNDAPGRNSPRRPPTRWTWVSTGISGLPKA